MRMVPEVQQLMELNHVGVSVCDFCQFGKPWRKRSRFLCGNIDSQDQTRVCKMCEGKRGECSRAHRPHFHLSGPAPNGTPWTAVAMPYPTRLRRSLAHVIYMSNHFSFEFSAAELMLNIDARSWACSACDVGECRCHMIF
jgi:hypothetical protein